MKFPLLQIFLARRRPTEAKALRERKRKTWRRSPDRIRTFNRSDTVENKRGLDYDIETSRPRMVMRREMYHASPPPVAQSQVPDDLRTLKAYSPRTSRELNSSSGSESESDVANPVLAMHLQDAISRQLHRDPNREIQTEGLGGNIYRYWAFRGVFQKFRIQDDPSRTDGLLLEIGLIFVMLLQIVGPPSIWVWTYYSVDRSAIKFGVGDWTYIPGSKDYGVSNLMKRTLGTLFLFVFILNAKYVIYTDLRISARIQRLAVIFNDTGDPDLKVYLRWLWVGAAVNSWCLVISCISMCPCFLLTSGPKGILFDGLSLLFLFNIDDATGDLGFLDDKWDAQEMGEFARVVEEVYQQQSCTIDDASQRQSIKDRIKHSYGFIYKFAHSLINVILVVMPIIFIFTEGVRNENEEFRAMQQQLKELNATLAALVNFKE